MSYSKDVLLSFLVTVRVAAGDSPPESESDLRAVFATAPQSSVREAVAHTVRLAFDRWSPDARVRVVHALTQRGLPSLLDVMLYVERNEQAVLRAKKIRDEADYRVAIELLNEVDTLTARQKKKVTAMVLAYEGVHRIS